MVEHDLILEPQNSEARKFYVAIEPAPAVFGEAADETHVSAAAVEENCDPQTVPTNLADAELVQRHGGTWVRHSAGTPLVLPPTRLAPSSASAAPDACSPKPQMQARAQSLASDRCHRMCALLLVKLTSKPGVWDIPVRSGVPAEMRFSAAAHMFEIELSSRDGSGPWLCTGDAAQKR